MASELRNFKIQVPSKRDKDALQDKRGRWWIKVGSRSVEPTWTQWEDRGEYYCWFARAERPEEGEYIELFEKRVSSIYQYKNVKRAVIKLRE